MELKDRIAAVRKAAGLTQEQLGELLGVTRQAVSKWESGQTTPDAATIAALCEKLHVSADYVLLAKSDMASFVDSLVAPLSLVNALIVAISREKAVHLESSLNRLESIWEEYDVYEKQGQD